MKTTIKDLQKKVKSILWESTITTETGEPFYGKITWHFNAGKFVHGEKGQYEIEETFK